MKKLLFILFIFPLFSSCSYIDLILPVDNTNDWGKTYGGYSNDMLTDALRNEKGFLLVGYSASYDNDVRSGNKGEYDWWIVQTDSVGRLLSQKSYGGAKSDLLARIKPLSTGGYILAGMSNSIDRDLTSNNGDYDAWIMKISSPGVKNWSKSYGGSQKEYLYDVLEMSNQKLMFAGYTISLDGDVKSVRHDTTDAWVFCTDEKGTMEWEKSYGGNGLDMFSRILSDGKNGFLMAGNTSSVNGDIANGNHGAMDIWVINTDEKGEIIWEKTFGGTLNDILYDMISIENGHYLLAGLTNSTNGNAIPGTHGGSDYWLLEIDGSGNIIWQKTFGGTAEDIIRSVQPTPDGYLLGGHTTSINGDVVSESRGKQDGWIVKIDKTGNLLWEKCLGGSNDEVVYKVIPMNGNKFMLGGSTSSTDKDITTPLRGEYDYWAFTTDSIH